FRRTFALDAELLSRAEGAFKLVIETGADEVNVEGSGKSAKVTGFPGVWLNGRPVPPEKWRPEREGPFVFEIQGQGPAYLRAGETLLAVRATPPGGRALLLQVALDEVRPNGAVIPLKAVVCDQCSTLPDQVQACVHACPHDAAMRVDAWTGFPLR